MLGMQTGCGKIEGFPLRLPDVMAWSGQHAAATTSSSSRRAGIRSPCMRREDESVYENRVTSRAVTRISFLDAVDSPRPRRLQLGISNDE